MPLIVLTTVLTLAIKRTTTTSKTNTQTHNTGLRTQFRMPPVQIRGKTRIADATFVDPHICRRLPLHDAASTAAARYDRREVAGMANFKMYLLRQFCSNRVDFFTIHRRHRRKK